jgi:hypothetical protein
VALGLEYLSLHVGVAGSTVARQVMRQPPGTPVGMLIRPLVEMMAHGGIMHGLLEARLADRRW